MIRFFLSYNIAVFIIQRRAIVLAIIPSRHVFRSESYSKILFLRKGLLRDIETVQDG